jgi:hypothetical protein
MTTKTKLEAALAERVARRHALADRLRRAMDEIWKLRHEIDDIGEEAKALGPSDPARYGADQLGCYASNSLEGTLALLRELCLVIASTARRPRR